METDDKLRDLLTAAAEKERRAYRRATLYVAAPVLLGIIWLAYSVTKVVRLEQRGETLKAKNDDLDRRIESKEATVRELEARHQSIQADIRTAQEEVQNNKPEAALDALSRAQASIRETGPVGRSNPTPSPTPSPAIGSSEIPNVEGLISAKAELRIKQAGFRVTKEDQAGVGTPGTVLYQDPLPGRSLPKGATIKIYIAIQREVIVPNVKGLTFAEAERIVRQAGLSVIREAQVGEGKSGHVLYQDPVHGTRIVVTRKVKLYVKD